MNGLFIFHRDFRLEDNKTLIELNSKCEKVYTCFIFTPEQVSSKNDFKSENSIQFMIESLKELEHNITKNKGTLLINYGDNKAILTKLITELNINVLACNIDYTPYAKERLKMMSTLCSKLKVELLTLNDYYLYEPGTIKVSSTGKAYTKYTPFYKKVKGLSIDKPVLKLELKLSKHMFKCNYSLKEASQKLITFNDAILVKGGRSEGLKILKSIHTFKKYDETRNTLQLETTQLSGFLKYGCISVREAALEFHKIEPLFKQLVWREFYIHILNDYPQTLTSALKEKYNSIKWSKSKTHLESWKNGTTGFPIVDAGMRQLNTTGYMHNRARLITACFLIKTLLINWQEGEKYFATKLLDYDPASNNGNWQWVASTGADSQPYFRIFNPWKQSRDYDKNCVYIKKWIPELKDIENKHIHEWDKYCEDYLKNGINYTKPIVDYKEQRLKALEMYKKIM